MGRYNGLHTARSAKNDEFYTQLTDIEKEMAHYREHFHGKTVYCNCDDPAYSNFWKYFHMNFGSLGLKKLISTHYDPVTPTYKLEYTGGADTDIAAGTKAVLHGSGDFQSPECIEILKEADIVVTNPPFSLFRKYISQLIEHEVKFIIIGNINAITYKEVFPLIKDNKIWLGASIHSGDREFRVPDTYPLNAAGWRVDEEGNKYIRVKGVRWFTNLDYAQRHGTLPLFRSYAEEPDRYPKYDTYDAINVDKTADIPADYDGVMGVPISFFDKHCPEQFKILGCTANPEGCSIPKKERSAKAVKLIAEKRLIGAKCVGGNSNIWIDGNDYVHVLYHRIFIQKLSTS